MAFRVEHWDLGSTYSPLAGAHLRSLGTDQEAFVQLAHDVHLSHGGPWGYTRSVSQVSQADDGTLQSVPPWRLMVARAPGEGADFMSSGSAFLPRN